MSALGGVVPAAAQTSGVQDAQLLRERLKQLFDQPDLLPDKLMAYLVDYLAVNQPPVPVGAVVGTASSISGTVTAAGGISSGTGYSVVHSGTGVYAITFTTALAATPVVLVTPIATSTRFVGVFPQAATGFTVQIANSAGTATDQDFNFTAIGT